jgi:hypothetical protein
MSPRDVDADNTCIYTSPCNKRVEEVAEYARRYDTANKVAVLYDQFSCLHICTCAEIVQSV